MKRTTWAIVPVKRLSQAKRRLAPVLPADARRELVIAMLQDVLGALVQVREIDRVLVVTPDAQVAEIARAAGASVLSEARSAGLNAAVKTGLAQARGHGATDALVLPADVPLATPDELRRIVTSFPGGTQPRALLAPSHDGEGTNALLLSPPGILQPSFGPGSFLRHLAQAVARKIELQIVQPSGLSHDIDEPRDLDRLMAYKRVSAGYAFLEAHLHKAEGRLQRPAREIEP
jgi:2-phospho-L-lactate/phosphoenolpyruvate guanylyltransferase